MKGIPDDSHICPHDRSGWRDRSDHAALNHPGRGRRDSRRLPGLRLSLRLPLRNVTGSWQYLTRSRGARIIVNTRHNDVVYVLHTGGTIGCFPPDHAAAGEIAPIIAIRISPSPVCQF